MSYPYNASGVMSSEELANLDDAMGFHRSADLERKVRDMAALCAESCMASGKPWCCYFMEPLRFHANAEDAHRLPASTGANEIMVDVRGCRDPYAATLIAEEQIRRQLAKHAWAKLPNLGGDR